MFLPNLNQLQLTSVFFMINASNIWSIFVSLTSICPISCVLLIWKKKKKLLLLSKNFYKLCSLIESLYVISKGNLFSKNKCCNKCQPIYLFIWWSSLKKVQKSQYHLRSRISCLIIWKIQIKPHLNSWFSPHHPRSCSPPGSHSSLLGPPNSHFPHDSYSLPLGPHSSLFEPPPHSDHIPPLPHFILLASLSSQLAFVPPSRLTFLLPTPDSHFLPLYPPNLHSHTPVHIPPFLLSLLSRIPHLLALSSRIPPFGSGFSPIPLSFWIAIFVSIIFFHW